jgi:hypothetical protein
MNEIQAKLLNALKNNKLNPNKTGERQWYNYFISVDELVWARNYIDAYLIHIYSNEYKKEHLATYTLTYDVVKK